MSGNSGKGYDITSSGTNSQVYLLSTAYLLLDALHDIANTHVNDRATTTAPATTARVLRILTAIITLIGELANVHYFF